MRAPLSIAGLTMLTACSGGGHGGTMDQIMQSWQGEPVTAVIAQWGYPQAEQTIAGRKVYHWYYNKSFQTPATTSGSISPSGIISLSTTPGLRFDGACTRSLEVDERNIVVRWQWSGNNCPILDIAGFEYGRWRNRKPD